MGQPGLAPVGLRLDPVWADVHPVPFRATGMDPLGGELVWAGYPV
jgi:hypothetical protein